MNYEITVTLFDICTSYALWSLGYVMGYYFGYKRRA